MTYAIGGAIALGYWGVPRATLDIDLTLWFEVGEARDALAVIYALGANGPGLEHAVADTEADGVVYLNLFGTRLDVFTPSIPYYSEALASRCRVDLANVGTIWLLSAESLVVFKLLFFRAKDLSDVERLLRVQGEQFDDGAVRRALLDIVGGDDERVAWLDAHIAKQPS
jgi:hypothetical protein